MSTKVTKATSIPQWLADKVDVLKDDLDAQSWSAAAALLLALGWETYTRHMEPPAAPDGIEALFGDEMDAWLDENRHDLPYPHLDETQNYLLCAVMPAKHGGNRDGAGRPSKPVEDHNER